MTSSVNNSSGSFASPEPRVSAYPVVRHPGPGIPLILPDADRGPGVPQLEQNPPKKDSHSEIGVATIKRRPLRPPGGREHLAMLKKDQPNVLPLHLTPLDAYFCADDDPRYPMSSIIQALFLGQIDQRAFFQALDIGRWPGIRC